MRRTKIVAAMLSLVFVFMLFPSLRVNAAVVASGDCGDNGDNVTWELDDNGTLTISGSGKMADYSYLSNIPWKDYKSSISSLVVEEGVTETGLNSFYYCENLKSVSLPTTLVKINNCSFLGCKNLVSLTIPDNVEYIGIQSFQACESLESITIPYGLKTIGGWSFMGCYNLISITIPNSVTSIGNSAFYKCTSLTSITIPNSVTSLGNWTFYKCTSLTSITIPDSVTSLADDAFESCDNLTTVTMSWSEYNKLGADLINKCFDVNTVTIYFCKETLTADNGTISVESRDYTNGTITLKLDPDTNYALGSVSVKYSDGTVEDVLPNNGKYIVDVTKGDIEVNATFIPAYEIQFVNADGTELQSSSVPYGETPVCTITPTQAATAQYTYTFAGWTPTIAPVTGDATYTATYTATTNEYTIDFVNEDNSVLESSSVPYGDTPVCTITPTKAADAQYTYTFSGWTPTIAPVTGDATYTATYSTTTNEYTVTFTDADGNQLQSGKLPYGTVPKYSGTPTKAETDKYTYTFAGWKSGNSTYGVSSTLPQVTGDVTYTAVFTETAKSTTPAPGTYYVQSIEEKDGAIVITIKRTENDDQTYELVQSIETDGKQLSVGDQIELTSGSAIITIKKDFVSTLTPGTHTMKVTFKDGGSITLEYTVKEPEKAAAQAVQATGEATAISAFVGAGLIIMACGLTIITVRKRREEA